MTRKAAGIPRKELRELMDRARLTQSDVSRITGLSQSIISRILVEDEGRRLESINPQTRRKLQLLFGQFAPTGDQKSKLTGEAARVAIRELEAHLERKSKRGSEKRLSWSTTLPAEEFAELKHGSALIEAGYATKSTTGYLLNMMALRHAGHEGSQPGREKEHSAVQWPIDGAPRQHRAQVLIHSCGSPQRTVDMLLEIWRSLFPVLPELVGPPTERKSSGKGEFLAGTQALLMQELERGLGAERVRALIDDRVLQGVFLQLKRQRLFVPKHQRPFQAGALHPLTVIEAVLADELPEALLKDCLRRNQRVTFHATSSRQTIRAFRCLCERMDTLMKDSRRWRKEDKSYQWAGLITALTHALCRDALAAAQLGISAGDEDDRAKEIARLFLECCATVGYIRAEHGRGEVQSRTQSFDAEYLICNLYGMPTEIPGLDDLFGGGGLLLTESSAAPICESDPGRTLLIRGTFGTGKSLLALQLAVEVARRGGASLLALMDLGVHDALYMLNSFYYEELHAFDVVTGTADVSAALKSSSQSRGILCLVEGGEASLGAFLQMLREAPRYVGAFPLRLIAVDPFTVMGASNGDKDVPARNEVHEILREIRAEGTNLVLVAEEDGSEPRMDFVEKISDTVIKLFVRKDHDYAQRYFEIVKSRYQREQRGEHPYSISAGEGIVILPSTAAVGARILHRTPQRNRTSVRYGHPQLEEIMREGAILQGDAIVVYGSGRSQKTALGLPFLLESDLPNKRDARTASLLVSARDDNEIVRGLLDEDYVQRFIAYLRRDHRREAHKRPDTIRICSMQKGHIMPGLVFQRIRQQVYLARREGYWIDRAMIDGISQWEMSCPTLRDDHMFGTTLVDFMRRLRITTLYICGTPQGLESSIQRSIIDRANCKIRLQRKGGDDGNITLEVEKTHSMRHSPRSYELEFGPYGPTIVDEGRGESVRRAGEQKSDHVGVPVQIDGKKRGVVSLARGLSEPEAVSGAVAQLRRGLLPDGYERVIWKQDEILSFVTTKTKKRS